MATATATAEREDERERERDARSGGDVSTSWRRGDGEVVDLAALTAKFPTTLARFVRCVGEKGGGGGGGGGDGVTAVVDWSDGDAVRAVTEATLLDWCPGLEWWRIPPACLCPAVPQRRAYVDWVHALLRGSSASNGNDKSDNARATDGHAAIRGLDVGTGASLVYPILGCCIHGWHFVATDVLPAALENARELIRRNEAALAGRISVRDARRASSPSLIEGALGEDEHFDFSMCNPPFFADVAEARRAPGSEAAGFFAGERNPKTCHGGLDEELVTPGGEERFVERIVLESFRTRDRIRWYTVMLGKKTTMLATYAMLRRGAGEVACLRTGALVLGKTRRWVVAWSFSHTSDVQCLIRELKKEKRRRRARKEQQKRARLSPSGAPV